MDHSENARIIFDKYAEVYHKKSMDVSIYTNLLDQFLELIRNNDEKVLLNGCSPGNITKYLLDKKPYLQITGVDISENMIGLARINNPNASFKTMDCLRIDELDQGFEAIIAGFFLPYLSRTEVSIFTSNCSGLLKTNGVLYLSAMKDDYEKSGLVGSSEGSEEQLQTFFYETEYLLSSCNEYNLEVIHTVQLENKNNKPGVKDLILIMKKRFG